AASWLGAPSEALPPVQQCNCRREAGRVRRQVLLVAARLLRGGAPKRAVAKSRLNFPGASYTLTSYTRSAIGNTSLIGNNPRHDNKSRNQANLYKNTSTLGGHQRLDSWIAHRGAGLAALSLRRTRNLGR